MAISGLENTVCNKLSGEFDKIYNSINGVSSQFDKIKKQITSQLDSMNFSTDDILNDAIGNLSSALDSKLPSLDESSLSDIINIINNCNFLSDDPILKNPLSLLNNAKDDLLSDFDLQLNDLKDSIPEFGTGNLINSLKDLLDPDGNDLTNNFKNLDKIINCVNSICGSGFSSSLSDMIDKTNEIYSAMGVVDDPLSSSYGTLDIDSIYSSVGLSSDNISKINSVTSSINSGKSKIKNTLSSASSIAKSFI